MQGIIDWLVDLPPTTLILFLASVLIVIVVIVIFINTLIAANKNKKHIAKNGYTCPSKDNEFEEKVSEQHIAALADDNEVKGCCEQEGPISNAKQDDAKQDDAKQDDTLFEEGNLEQVVVEKQEENQIVSKEQSGTQSKSEVSQQPAKTKKSSATEQELIKKQEEQEAQLEAGCIIAEHIEQIESKDKRRGKIEIYKDNTERFRFRIIAANHEPVGHSQSYGTKAACKAGIKSMLKYSDTEVFDMTIDKDYKPKIGTAAFEIYLNTEGKYRFRLRSKNYRLVLASQNYTTKAASQIGIEAVKKISENFTLQQ